MDLKTKGNGEDFFDRFDSNCNRFNFISNRDEENNVLSPEAGAVLKSSFNFHVQDLGLSLAFCCILLGKVLSISVSNCQPPIRRVHSVVNIL